jgi:hypothetical protein
MTAPRRRWSFTLKTLFIVALAFSLFLLPRLLSHVLGVPESLTRHAVMLTIIAFAAWQSWSYSCPESRRQNRWGIGLCAVALCVIAIDFGVEVWQAAGLAAPAAQADRP